MVPRAELLGRIRAAGTPETADIVELRQMTSGDLLISTKTEAAREKLKRNT